MYIICVGNHSEQFPFLDVLVGMVDSFTSPVCYRSNQLKGYHYAAFNFRREVSEQNSTASKRLDI